VETRPYTFRRGLYVLGQGIRRAPWVFGCAVLGSALYGVMTNGGAWALARVTERVIEPALRTGSIAPADLASGAGLMAGTALLLTLGVIVRRVAGGYVVYSLGANFRRQVTRKYLELPLAWHSRHPTGQLLSTANSDVEATWQVFAPLPMALGVIIMLVVAGVSMFAADPVLALIGATVFPLLFGVNLVFQRYMSPRVTLAQRLRGTVSDVAHESFDGALVVKTTGREAAETERFAAAAHALRDANAAVGRTRGVFDPIIESLPALGTLAVLGVGTIRVANGDITAATVVEVAYLFSILGFPVRAFGWVLGELPRSVVGWDRIQAVIQAQGGLDYGTDVARGTGPARLELEGVEFSHQPGEPILRDFSLRLKAGRIIALVGRTGAGKSTLAQLLLRLADPNKGLISLDGQDLRSLAAGELTRRVALVPQQAFLFDDTVRGNVTLGDSRLHDPDDARVWAALRLAQAEGFVAGLSAGLDTQVGERGTSLSGGQRQRIALARALIRQPGLLILDDSTSAVDPTVEAAILAGLRTLGGGTTVLVMAFRKATIALADEVVFLDGGRASDSGPHAELILRQSDYATIVDAYERQAAARMADHTLTASEPSL
jgi:ATP-binding cassette, subfamily B, bacterial